MVKLEEPIMVTVKNIESLQSPVLAWWDPETGMWTRNACWLSNSAFSPYLTFSCNRLGYFSLSSEQNKNNFNLDKKLAFLYVCIWVLILVKSIDHFSSSINDYSVQQGLLFHFLHPAVYVGTFMGVTCLLLASATYCFCYTYIQMSKKMKHSLMNSWLSASLFFLVFRWGRSVICAFANE